MKTVLVTGSRGFVGQNLLSRLQLDKDVRLLTFDVENSDQDLKVCLDQADFIIHLAGVNRPRNDEDFQIVNADLTTAIVDVLQAKGRKTPVALSSSTQAALDNPYGRSKKRAEDAVFDYSIMTGAEVYVYRFPNLFGKWSRPNYNSVVATFCHNISCNLPIQINNPDHLLTLAYIDDVVAEILRALSGEAHRNLDGFCFVPEQFKITVHRLATLITSFRESRETAIVPDMDDPLTKRLYATYLSYLDSKAFSYFADMKTDQRGWLFELIKSPHIGQIFVSQTKPGITRGGHYHHTKVEKFVVVQGEAVIRFRQVESDEVIEYPVSGSKIEVVDIPPGYTHDITNVGSIDVITLFWASEIFDPENTDTYYLQVS